MQLPTSTPSDALLYEFGINDLTLEILMEKVILAVQVLKSGDENISKQLLVALFSKNVPGFCSEVHEACKILDLSLEQLVSVGDPRKFIKKQVIKLHAGQLLKRMLMSSKMDKVIMSGYSFDGKMKNYLLKLRFDQAKAIFMTRYRMWPNKVNFPGRWEDNIFCNICGCIDDDEHIFSCPGYTDLILPGTCLNDFFNETVLKNITQLQMISDMAVKLINRMKTIQEI